MQQQVTTVKLAISVLTGMKELNITIFLNNNRYGTFKTSLEQTKTERKQAQREQYFGIIKHTISFFTSAVAVVN